MLISSSILFVSYLLKFYLNYVYIGSYKYNYCLFLHSLCPGLNQAGRFPRFSLDGACDLRPTTQNMPRWTWLDIGIYFGLIAVEIPLRLGICGTIMVWFRVVLFALGLLPLRILLGFSLITFRCRDPFAQHATLMEFTTIQCARWAFETFRPETMSEVLFGKGTFKVMHKFRRFLFGTSSLGDNVFVDVNTPEMNGYWVRSLSRATHHYDCIIYFVPGCLMGFVSPWAYIEFAQLILVGLQQQGFHNPAMFVVDPEYNKCDYKHSFSRVLSGWTYATKVDPSSIHVDGFICRRHLASDIIIATQQTL